MFLLRKAFVVRLFRDCLRRSDDQIIRTGISDYWIIRYSDFLIIQLWSSDILMILHG